MYWMKGLIGGGGMEVRTSMLATQLSDARSSGHLFFISPYFMWNTELV